MQNVEIMEIINNGKTYYVDRLKIMFVLSKLTDDKNLKKSDEKIIEEMKRFSLLDKSFLTNLNKL